MVYSAEADPYCYPGTTVLRNRADLMRQEDLDEFELAMTLLRAEEPWPAGNLDCEHYLRLHHHLFQDVYDWAGKIRSVRIGKAGNWFCYPEYIDRELQRLFAVHGVAHLTDKPDLAEFRMKSAVFLSELNAIHPFRDGNGRTQMAFIAMLSQLARYTFDEDALHPQDVIDAMIASFRGELAPLHRLMCALILPGT